MRRVHFLAVAAAALLFAGNAARAQQPVPYPGTSTPYGFSPVEDQAIHMHVMMDQLEGRFGAAGNSFRWSGAAWAGTDTNRIWLKSEGEVGAGGTLEDGQQEILYDRPISPWFDLQAGLRSDIDSERRAATGPPSAFRVWRPISSTSRPQPMPAAKAIMRRSWKALTIF